MQLNRQFTWWTHVKLGRHIRRLIPSCAVHKIKQMFPEEDGVYCGFIGDDEGAEKSSEIIEAWELEEDGGWFL